MNPTGLAPAGGPALELDGTFNFRSTAGYPAASGRVRPGGLFRSDALHELSPQDQQAFAALNISRIIDLRDPEELQWAPSVSLPSRTETVHHAIFGSGAGLPENGASSSIFSVYRFIIEQRTDRVAGAVRLIADAPAGGVLVHCTAGKDRTGIVVATALTAIGVPRDQVVADYAASAQNLAGDWAERMLAGAAERFGELDDQLRELLVGSPDEAIERTLDLIEDRYGSVRAMLLTHGLDDETLDRLERRLVA